MAALWLQSVSLLVLLVVSWPSSQAAAPPQHLCGANLVEALELVCGDRGFFYNPRRSIDSLPGFFPPEAGGAAASGKRKAVEVTSGIVEECCHKPCNMFELQNFCV